jgi:hypothetical protein
MAVKVEDLDEYEAILDAALSSNLGLDGKQEAKIS